MKKKLNELEEIKGFELEDNSKKSLYIKLSIISVVVILALIVIVFCSIKLYKEYKQMNNEQIIKGNITIDSISEVEAKAELQEDVVLVSLNSNISDVYKILVYQDSNLILDKSFVVMQESTTKTYSFSFNQNYNYMIKIETIN